MDMYWLDRRTGKMVPVLNSVLSNYENVLVQYIAVQVRLDGSRQIRDLLRRHHVTEWARQEYAWWQRMLLVGTVSAAVEAATSPRVGVVAAHR